MPPIGMRLVLKSHRSGQGAAKKKGSKQKLHLGLKAGTRAKLKEIERARTRMALRAQSIMMG